MDRLSDYDYHLPEAAIAQRPLADRADSKLLWLHKNGCIEHRHFREVAKVLEPGDLLVLNDTRVTALRLFGRKTTGANIELLLLEDLGNNRFEALAKPGNRLQPGSEAEFEDGLSCKFLENRGNGRKLVQFCGDRAREKINAIGQVPLPPYIREKLEEAERYQTVYAANPGSAAAPTAGLHFTGEIFESLAVRGVQLARVTLDVGLDTFRPVKAENLDEHEMHGERCSVPKETAAAVAACKGRIIAVGTTAVRTLESFAVGRRRLETGTKMTNVFIRPGYQFKIIDGMFTNFHMPRTTMLIMLSTLVPRERILEAYSDALSRGYRFLSFGDSMLIL